MANPLSDRGWSDRDYAAAVGTLVGEAAARGGLRDYQAIADVLTNRLEAGVYGKSISSITMNPREFSTWSPKEKNAFANARAGFAAALNPSRAASLSPAIRGRVEMAKQALTDVNVTGVARGLTQGATAYHNPEVTAKLGTGGWHNMLEDRYGGIQIGAHSFTGPGFRPDQPFDPITYNGQLAAPPAADVFLGDVGLPVNRIDVSSIPDITPASAGFSLDGATLPADLSMDFSQYDTPISLRDFAAPNMGTMPAEMDMGTFNDVFDAGFPSQSVEAPGGFAAGFDAGPWGTMPDFSAPSLTERNAVDAFDNAMAVRTNTPPDLTNEALAAGLMAELAPQTAPQAPIAPAPVASAPAQSFSSPPAMGDFDEFGPNFPAASTPQPVAQVPSVPSVSLPSAPASTTRTQQQVAKDYDLPSFDLPDTGLPSMPTIRDVGATFGLMDPTAKTGFMDAMANPQIAQGWSPGFLDTRLGKATTGAATGFLTGGPFGAVTNGLWSGLGIGDMIGNAFDRYANAYANLSPLDFAAFMVDGNPYDREPTRMDNSGNATVGDGSWGSQSGVNDNNPQGIL